MDKLDPVQEVLIQKDDDWDEWGVEDLVENLWKFAERNPLRDNKDTEKKTPHVNVQQNKIDNRPVSGFKSWEEYKRTYESRQHSPPNRSLSKSGHPRQHGWCLIPEPRHRFIPQRLL